MLLFTLRDFHPGISAVDTRLPFLRGEFVDVLHTFSGKIADTAEQADFVWCLNSSENEFVVCLFFKLKMTVMMMAKLCRILGCWYG